MGGGHVRPLLRSKTPEVLDIVRQVASGKGYVAIAITEPGAGSDVPSIASSARKAKDGFLLTGEKRFNARLGQATHVVIFTQCAAGETGVDLGDRLRDLNGLRIADGTTDVMRINVVRQVYGEEFWEMAVSPKKAKTP